ncbi:7985_t:CDS:2 [Funneliformis geosporum]|uniref:3401_t:CDS:1 n=1 Tax=Funneliformis geosporum TaxID=1117311 RepID=A0A9W4T504_9GLOM|nr:7985_t:CDS:2 [Funneliformis geosporum]CAI2192952.1 3401_t:CDS:2 [Funneliformis geosporum]
MNRPTVPLINILRRTNLQRNNLIIFSRHSFIYSRIFSTTKNSNTNEITITNSSTIEKYKQASNREATWSNSQRTRTDAMIGPRFEQVDLEAQPRPLAAIELVAEEPIHYVEGRIAVCHGGGGALGHPQIYINLDQPGAHSCGYCGIRFERKHHH